MAKYKGNLKTRMDTRAQQHQVDWRQPIAQMVSKPQGKPTSANKPQRTMSEAARAALALIGGWRVVRSVGGWGYYYVDAALRGIAWIEKRVIDELKSFKAVRIWRGVLVTEQQYKLARA